MKPVFLTLFLFLTHCVSTNSVDLRKDLIIAHTALKRAKKASANKFFPKSYSKAIGFYKEAFQLFEASRSHEAKKLFQQSTEISEKIELHSLYKKKRNLEL